MFSTKDFELERASRFQALADPVRLQIVALLQTRMHCVCEIQSAIGPIAPNLLSYHLGILRNAGLITAQRRGRWIDYQLAFAAFEELRASLPQGGTAPPAPQASSRSGSGCCAPAQPVHRPAAAVRRRS